MISPSTFRDLVSGRRRGLGGALARLAMGAASATVRLLADPLFDRFVPDWSDN